MVEPYLYLLLTVFFFNLLPAFAPPTWVVLSNFQLSNGFDPFLTIAIGLVGALSGRVVMYYYSKHLYPFLPKKKKEKVAKLHKEALEHEEDLGLLMFFYSLGPLPSNVVFIFSGIAKIPLLPVALGFFFGRLISYGVAMFAFDTFLLGLKDYGINVLPYLDIISLLLTIAILFVDWDAILRFIRPKQQKG
ncbi:MAG: hypothetical protein D6769_03110 [Methanobacteriota archaeon]|nr:MAG: hypothetical protein D6769_03110 [Euryarchaeota archaeon]